MKTLLLLRHAKSSWKDTDLEDYDRPLNKRGKRDAPKMGRLLVEENLLPDLIVSSSARRCRKTAEHVLQVSHYRGETRFSSQLYEANTRAHAQFVAGIDDSVNRLLLIGHNPGLEELLETLTGVYTPLTTAALAQLELPIESWSKIDTVINATLVKVWQPRELED
jgi:phosphohistidine phosphatase